MSIAESLLPEFEHEMQNTRKALERVPEDKFGWKPHEKSMTMGRLAQHMAELPGWAAEVIETDSLNMNPGEYKPPKTDTRQQLLELFDSNVAKARAAIAATNDAHLSKEWALTAGGQTILKMARTSVLRAFCMSHMIHHRGQLTVYLRLNNIAVPSLC